MTNCYEFLEIVKREFSFLEEEKYGFRVVYEIDRSSWGRHGYCRVGFQSRMFRIVVSYGAGVGITIGFLDTPFDPEQRNAQKYRWRDLELLNSYLDDPTLANISLSFDEEWLELSIKEQLIRQKRLLQTYYPRINALYSLESRRWYEELDQALTKRVNAYMEESNRQVLDKRKHE